MHPKTLAGGWSIWNSGLLWAPLQCLWVTVRLYILSLGKVKVMQHSASSTPHPPPCPGLVSNSSCNKIPETWWLTTIELDSPTVLRAKIQVWAGLVASQSCEREPLPHLLASGGCWLSLVWLAVPHSDPRLCHPRAYFPMSLCVSLSKISFPFFF